MVRSGSNVAGYYSSDGSTWTAFGETLTLSMATSPSALVVSSDTNAGRATAQFDHLTFDGTLYTASDFENDGTHRPLTVNTLDAAGEVTATYQFDGDGVSMVDANDDGVPDALDLNGDGIPTDPDLNGDGTVDSTSPLRAYTETDYDDQGRVYQTIQFSVDPITGAI